MRQRLIGPPMGRVQHRRRQSETSGRQLYLVDAMGGDRDIYCGPRPGSLAFGASDRVGAPMRFEPRSSLRAARPECEPRWIERADTLSEVIAPKAWTSAMVEAWLAWADDLPADYPPGPPGAWPPGAGRWDISTTPPARPPSATSCSLCLPAGCCRRDLRFDWARASIRSPTTPPSRRRWRSRT